MKKIISCLCGIGIVVCVMGINNVCAADQKLPLTGDWNNNGTDAIGLYDQAAGKIYLKDANTEGVYDKSFTFGSKDSSWLPIVGDWNNNGTDTMGLYDPIGGNFYLKNSNTDGEADYVFRLGPRNSSWLPIVGDWNNNGTDTIGLYDQAAGKFYLKNENAAGKADLVFRFGPINSSWLPIVGDWNNDGIDTIGLYDPVAGKFYLKNSNSGGNAEYVFRFGSQNSSWLLIAGDWNNDGIDTIGLYDPVAGKFYLKNSNSGGNAEYVFVLDCTSNEKDTIGLYDQVGGNFYLKDSNTAGEADYVFRLGPRNASWLSVSGDWDNDGMDTLGLYNPEGGAFYLKNENTAGNADCVVSFGPRNSYWLPITGDWNNNSQDTIGLYDPIGGNFYLNDENSAGNAEYVFRFGVQNSSWLPIAGDWNNDGIDTVGLYDPIGGNFYLKDSNTAGEADYVFRFGAQNSSWLPIAGDWNNDGIDTVGLYDPIGGNFYLKNENTAGNADCVVSFGPRDSNWLPLVGDWDNSGNPTNPPVVIENYSQLVYPGEDGKLIYVADENGNTIPDFSCVGYKKGEQNIPTVSVVKTISPIAGDNREHIQQAIDEVAGLALNNYGIRGALLLKAGEYRVEGTLEITASGIVLRGEGDGVDGTRIIATQSTQHDLLSIHGEARPIEGFTWVLIDEQYVPVGTKTFTVKWPIFQVGDRILVRKSPNQAWIEMLGMDHLEDYPGAIQNGVHNWEPDDYIIKYKRVIKAINGDQITIDAPIVDQIDSNYATGDVTVYSWPGKITNVGVENIRFVSEYAHDVDENHGWNAIVIDNTQDSWIRNVTSYYFGYGTVYILEHGYRISVLNCRSMDPKSQTTGGRKYPFQIKGQLILVKDCYSHSGRHDFVTGGRTAGPNAFVNCTAENQLDDIGPHHRWATGTLFDNIKGDGQMNVRDRGPSGTGHGWAGAQTLFWNSEVDSIIVQNPPNHINWAIGNISPVITESSWTGYHPGYIESHNEPVWPQSLYEQQLRDRLY